MPMTESPGPAAKATVPTNGIDRRGQTAELLIELVVLTTPGERLGG